MKFIYWKVNDFLGLFVFDYVFFLIEGVYWIYVDGIFFLFCNVIFKGYGKGNLFVIIVIDNNIDIGERLLLLNENFEWNVIFNVVGFMKLR